MSAEEFTKARFEDPSEQTRLADFLILAPVLLRAQSRRVVAELVVTAAADLIPEMVFSGLILMNETTPGFTMIAHRNHRLLLPDESSEILEYLPSWLFLDPEQALIVAEQPIIVDQDQLERPLRDLTGASIIYLYPARTPTRRFGYLLGGAKKELSKLSYHYLQALAQLAAIALDNASRFDDLKETAHEMNLVNEMAGSLAASLNGEELFNSFMERLREIIPVQQANLILTAPLGQTYSMPFSWSDPPGKTRRTYIKELPIEDSPFEEPIIRQEIMSGTWVTHPNDTPLDEVNVFEPRYQSQLIIPLIARKQIVGALALGTEKPDSYREERLHHSLIEKLSSLFALALLNSRLYEEKQLSAEFDSRVGVFNHDYFDRELATQLHKASRSDYRLGLMMVDMDNLKAINDRYGHLAGDAALRHIATLISRTVRATDVVARYGGDEFGIILPGCTQFGLEVVAEKTRRAIRSTPLLLENGEEAHLSVSIGAVIYPEDARSPRELIQQADTALYIAKSTRDRVCIGKTAHAPRVSEYDLGNVEPPDLTMDPEVLSSLKIEDYERFLLWLGGDRSSVESKVIFDLNEQLSETRRELAILTGRAAQLESSLLQSLQLLAEIVEMREPYLQGGAVKMVRLVRLLGEHINLGEPDLMAVEAAAWLANLGRLAVPESVWNQPGRLNNAELRRVRKTPLDAVRLASKLQVILPAETILAIQFQRERFDGRGYPMRLAGEEIPIHARLLGVASALVAMCQPRPYRAKRTRAVCQRYLERGAGRQFDANLCGILLKLMADEELEFLEFA
ncbi:MAG TPA: diguanylate cyclase [Chloroflexia bacterium]|nr:diguanylate cyclase [Chloroflexia bacterium]